MTTLPELISFFLSIVLAISVSTFTVLKSIYNLQKKIDVKDEDEVADYIFDSLGPLLDYLEDNMDYYLRLKNTVNQPDLLSLSAACYLFSPYYPEPIKLGAEKPKFWPKNFADWKPTPYERKLELQKAFCLLLMQIKLEDELSAKTNDRN